MPRKAKRGNGGGSVWRLGKRWRWQITIGYDADGSRQTLSGMCDTKTEAVDAMAATITDRKRGDAVDPSKITVVERLEMWLERSKGRISPSSYESYKNRIAHVTDHVGHLRLQALTPDHVKALVVTLQQDRAEREGTKRHKKLSSRMVRGVVSLLKTILDDAVESRILRHNPARIRLEVGRTSNAARAATSWTAEEARQFIEANRKTPHFALFYLALALGLRRGELLGLRWENVDLQRRTITVSSSLVRVAGSSLLRQPKTQNSVRRLRLPGDVVAVLDDHRRVRSPEQRPGTCSASKVNP